MCNNDVYLIYTKIFANYYHFSYAKFDVQMQIKSHELHTLAAIMHFRGGNSSINTNENFIRECKSECNSYIPELKPTYRLKYLDRDSCNAIAMIYSPFIRHVHTSAFRYLICEIIKALTENYLVHP